MQTLFECTARYSKAEEGTDAQKRVTEVYLFDAINYTEAEARANETLADVIQGEFMVTNIRKAKYAEVINSEEGGYWYRVKVSFMFVDENTGKEKRISQMVLCLADSIKSAVDRVVGSMGETADFRVLSVNESPIVDFFPLFSREAAVKAEKEVGRRAATPEELAKAAAMADIAAEAAKRAAEKKNKQ